MSQGESVNGMPKLTNCAKLATFQRVMVQTGFDHIVNILEGCSVREFQGTGTLARGTLADDGMTYLLTD